MRAAIYVRQSLDRSGEGAAVDRQLAECTELAERNSWAVAEVYRDNDASASNGKRPDWQRLLADLDAGLYDVLVCWHTDRLYRRVRDLVDLVEIAERRPLRISSVKAAEIDLSTPAGRMLAGMLGHAARYEVEQKGARQVSANRARAQDGTVLWTRRPFGFDRSGTEVRVVKKEAAALEAAASKVLAGATLASVARDLNKRGISTSLGREWSVTSLKRALLNPRVAGHVVYRGELMSTNGPAILDTETYDRLQALLTDPRRKTAPSTVAKFLLSGIARCGREECDREPMFSTTNGAERIVVYRCRKCYGARHRDRVDEVVLATIAARLARPDAASLLSTEVDVAALQAQAAELRDRRDALAMMLADGLLGADAVKVQAKTLTDRLGNLERQIDAAMGESPLADVIGADDVVGRLAELPLTALRAIVRELCEVVILPAGKGIRFAPDQVQVIWR
ncbi:recombinase family protein [Pimelobacter simplex]|uniref:recombinase family protein n=1 Tax=Nocardioides simplex TaxID=2045 RepID=UPI0019339785|nr:recombinase family protein [Pimelobacter simplex]